MSYTPAMMDAAVAALVRNVHGLHPDVARAWATAEQGVNYNILGVTYSNPTGQHLYVYGSWDEGAASAARLIANGPYAGIRAALAGGTSQAQAQAVIASPWNHPYYSRGAGAAALRAIAAGPVAPPASHTLHIAAGATMRYAGIGGGPHSPRLLTPFHPVHFTEGSKAPCGAPMDMLGTDGRTYRVAVVSDGPYTGRAVQVGNGVTVTE